MTAKTSPETVEDVLLLKRAHPEWSGAAIADALNQAGTPIHKATVCKIVSSANREEYQEYSTTPEPIEPIPSDDHLFTAEELLDQKAERFSRIANLKTAEKVRTIIIRDPKPIAVCHLGDPHIDDDGCNVGELRRTIETIKRTPGMMAGNVGDTHNNWVGRLQGLYQEQSTTFDEALQLSKWLANSVKWLYWVEGNHDKWRDGSQITKLLLQGSDVLAHAKHEARLELQFPVGDPIRIVARHDFKGHSMWNPTHGSMKESKFDPWGDLFVSGHRHIWAIHREEGRDSKPRTSILVRGYKYFDDFAEAKQFHQHEHGESLTTILQPAHEHPCERVRVYHDVDEAADVLTWLRSK